MKPLLTPVVLLASSALSGLASAADGVEHVPPPADYPSLWPLGIVILLAGFAAIMAWGNFDD